MDIAKFGEWGLIGAIIGALFFCLWRMLIWVMRFVNDITKQQAEERIGWKGTLDKHNEIINKISDSIDDHDKRADERGRYVREEHKEMIDVLRRINGVKDNG